MATQVPARPPSPVPPVVADQIYFLASLDPIHPFYLPYSYIQPPARAPRPIHIARITVIRWLVFDRVRTLLLVAIG